MQKNHYCHKILSAKNVNKSVNAIVLVLENRLGELLFVIICCSSSACSFVLDVSVGIPEVKIERTLLVVVIPIVKEIMSYYTTESIPKYVNYGLVLYVAKVPTTASESMTVLCADQCSWCIMHITAPLS